MGAGAAFLLFLARSGDTLAVLLAILADTAEGLEIAVLAGVALSLAWLVGLTFRLGRVTSGPKRLERQADRLLPWVMIAAGLYVLADSVTD